MWDFLKDHNSISAFLYIVTPGLVSIYTYHFFTPRPLDWKTLPFEACVYGFICRSIQQQLIDLCLLQSQNSPMSILAIAVLLGLIPFIFRLKWLKRWARYPCNSAWNYAFEKSKKNDFFVIVHLKNGKNVAGYAGDQSFFSPSTSSGDIFLQWEYALCDDSSIGEYKHNSKGILIKSDEISHIEFQSKGVENE